MGRPTGIEPAATRTTIEGSTTELRSPQSNEAYISVTLPFLSSEKNCRFKKLHWTDFIATAKSINNSVCLCC